MGFDPLGAADAGEDAPHPSVAWAGVFAVDGTSSGSGTTVGGQALLAGDAVVVHAYCGSPTAPTAVAVTASGWSFFQISPITGSASARDWAASFGAIAPDTMTAQLTVTWNVANCTLGTDTLVDELTGNDPTGGATTFYAHDERAGTGDCSGSVTVTEAGDAVWAGCSATILATGPGFTKGADDGGGNWTEYQIASSPAVTTATFRNTTGDTFVETVAAIRHR